MRRLKRREYKPGAPLYARAAMKLRGVVITSGQLIPAELLSSKKHKQLWFIGKADHMPPKGSELEAPPVALVVEPPPMLLEEPSMPTLTPPLPADLDLDSLSPEEFAELEAATSSPLPLPVVTARAPAIALSTSERPRTRRR